MIKIAGCVAIMGAMDRVVLNKNERKALDSFLERLSSLFGPRLRRPKLYGSAVRGERHEESDIDILVLIDGLTWEEKCRVWDEATDANVEFDAMLSPLVMTPEEMRLLRERERRIALDIDSEGVDA